MTKLTIPPDETRYSVIDGTEVVRVALSGGKGRYRRDIIGASSSVNVAWTVNKANFAYLRNFYTGVTDSGATPFEIDLIVDDESMKEYSAHFVPGTFRLARVRGLSYTVTAQLEVYPNEATGELSVDYARALAMLQSNYGGTDNPNDVNFVNILEKLVNVDFDASLS